MSIDEFSEGDIIYRINSHCLVGGISDKDFRNNAQNLLEDIRGYFMGHYEVMAEFRPPQMDGCIACHDDLNARIAELTAEVARYKPSDDVKALAIELLLAARNDMHEGFDQIQISCSALESVCEHIVGGSAT
jgi:hypothetical protein